MNLDADDFCAVGAGASPLADINMIPLIDVMLVLLIVFMVTAPLLTHAVRVNLPVAESRPEASRRQDIDLAIQGDGALHWNGVAVSADALPALMARAIADPGEPPELRIRADRTVPYGRIAEVMALASRGGLFRIGFVSEPPAGSGFP